MLQQHVHCSSATTIIKLIIFVAYGAWWVCLCCHNWPNSDMNYRIFIVRTDVNACDFTWGCTDSERESALKVNSRKKIPCHTAELNGVTVRCSIQLSCIPSPCERYFFARPDERWWKWLTVDKTGISKHSPLEIVMLFASSRLKVGIYFFIIIIH